MSEQMNEKKKKASILENSGSNRKRTFVSSNPTKITDGGFYDAHFTDEETESHRG